MSTKESPSPALNDDDVEKRMASLCKNPSFLSDLHKVYTSLVGMFTQHLVIEPHLMIPLLSLSKGFY